MARWFMKNPGFELGDRDWTKQTGWTIENDAGARTGAWLAKFTGSSATSILQTETLPMRPGGKITVSAWFDGSAATGGGTGRLHIFWLDKDDNVVASSTPPPGISAGQAGYIFEEVVDQVAPAKTKFVQFGPRISNTPDGSTWLADDVEASGDIIETIPASAIIREHRLVYADTLGVFDPLVGPDKFTDFNAGKSDKWSGVYTFIPALPGADLGELVAFIRRLGKVDRFFAFNPDRQTPVNGVVNDMVVDGAVTAGTTRIPVRGGPVSTTALLRGEYAEIRAQYFEVQRDLEIGPEGTGNLIVRPAVRTDIADGEDVITDHPKCVARITSDFDLRRFESHPVGPLAISWEEV